MIKMLGKRRVHKTAETARRERQVPVTADDLAEIEKICQEASEAHYGDLRSAQMTRGGAIVRAWTTVGTASEVMRTALESVGYVVTIVDGRTIAVTGWDPMHYNGDSLTVARIDDHIEELLTLRATLLNDEMQTKDQR